VKGLPEFGGRAQGDLFLRLRVQVPHRLSARERELYEALRASGGTQRPDGIGR
jgi:molecular chaperone DnaJ